MSENKLNVILKSNVDQCVVEDIITYTIKINNNSSSIVESVTVRDLLTSDLKFIKESVSINFKPSINSSIISGVYLDNINIGETYIITFDAQIINYTNKYISNEVTIEYMCKEDNINNIYYTTSNKLELLVKNPQLNIIRNTNKEYFFLNDIIEYTLVITNTGDLDLFNILFIDNLPSSMKLLDNTFSIDNKLVNSVEVEKGVLLNSLPIGKTKIVKYNVQLISSEYINNLENNCLIKYSYTLPNGFIGSRNKVVPINPIYTYISNFKQLTLDKYVILSQKEPNLKEINSMKVKVNISKSEIIKTCNGTSTEGKSLSGYKLIIHGDIKQVFEYISYDYPQSLNCLTYDDLFSTYITLPKDVSIKSKIDVECVVENIYYTVIDERCFFKSVNLLLFAKIN